MADTRGVWGLSEAWAEKASAEWTPIDDVWVTDKDYSPPSVPYSDKGYTLGGRQGSMPAGSISSIERFTFSSGSSSLTPSNLPSPRTDERGTAGPTMGVSGCQYSPSSVIIAKLTLSNETVSSSPAGGYNSGHANCWAGNTTTAYGAAMHGTLKYTYNTDSWDYQTTNGSATIGYPSSPVGSNWNQYGAGSGSAVAGTPNEGYWSWANSESWFSKISYATDTGTVRVGTLLSSSYMYQGGGSATYTDAYWFGGGNNYNNWPSPTNISLQVMPFSTLTCRLSPGVLTGRNNGANRIPNGNTECYLAGGYESYPSPFSTNVIKLTYATETSSAHPSPILVGRRYHLGYSTTGDGAAGQGAPTIRWVDSAAAAPDSGIFAGGGPSNGGSAIDKLDFVTETVNTTTSIPGGNSNTMNLRQSHFGSSITTGYLCMGRIPPSPWNEGISSVYKYTYASDTVARSLPNFPSNNAYGRGYRGVAVDSSTATTISNLYGQAQGGYPDAHRVTHATDATSAVPGLGPDSTSPSWGGRNGTAAVSNIDGGNAYWTGGRDPYGSATQKVIFSTDTRQNLPGSPYPMQTWYHTGVGGPTHGYFATGYSNQTGSGIPSYQTKLYKFSYSSETFNDAGNLTGITYQDGRTNAGSTGNTTQGYIFGSDNEGESNVDKFVYSTDTISNLPGIMPSNNPDSYSRSINAGAVSVLQSNRTNAGAAPVPPSNDPPIGYGEKQGRFNNPVFDHGYIAGGEGSPGAGTSSDDSLVKLALSTDTATEVPAGVGPNYRGTAKGLSSGNGAYAYFAGGQNSASTSVGLSYLRRVDYSNDTASLAANITANAYSSGNQARKNMIAFGNEIFGFWALGRSGSQLSSMIRLNYSNATSSSWAWRNASPGQWPQVYDGEWNIGPSWGTTRTLAATGGTPSRAYIGTMYANDVYSNVLRYQYVYSQSTTIPSGNGFKTRARGTGNSTSTNWYIGGGHDGNYNLSSVDKMNFSSETVELVPGLNLSPNYTDNDNGHKNAAGVAAGNSHGYWCGVSATTGNKVDYPTETASIIPMSSGSNPGKFTSGTSMKDFGNNLASISPPSTII